MHPTEKATSKDKQERDGSSSLQRNTQIKVAKKKKSNDSKQENSKKNPQAYGFGNNMRNLNSSQTDYLTSNSRSYMNISEEGRPVKEPEHF